MMVTALTGRTSSTATPSALLFCTEKIVNAGISRHASSHCLPALSVASSYTIGYAKEARVPLVHHPLYSQVTLPAGHRFPMQVFQHIHDHLVTTPGGMWYGGKNVHLPPGTFTQTVSTNFFPNHSPNLTFQPRLPLSYCTWCIVPSMSHDFSRISFRARRCGGLASRGPRYQTPLDGVSVGFMHQRHKLFAES